MLLIFHCPTKISQKVDIQFQLTDIEKFDLIRNF